MIFSIFPLVLIAGLLWVALYVKPEVTGKSIPPPPIDRRDRLFGVVSPEKNVIWAVGSVGKVIRSNDEGKSFFVQNTPLDVNFQDIAAWDARRAVVVGNQGAVIVTQDGGKTWKEVTTPLSKVTNKFIRVKVYPDGKAWIVGEMGAVLFSSDYGETWVRRVEEKDVGRNDISFASSKNGWVVGEMGEMLHTTDGGKTWKESKDPPGTSLMAVAFRDNNHGTIVGMNGRVLLTSNGGKKWNPVDNTMRIHLFDVTWNGHNWLAVGEKGYIVIGDDSGQQWRAVHLSDSDLSSHVEIHWAWDSAYLGGGTLGRWKDGKWNIFPIKKREL